MPALSVKGVVRTFMADRGTNIHVDVQSTSNVAISRMCVSAALGGQGVGQSTQIEAASVALAVCGSSFSTWMPLVESPTTSEPLLDENRWFADTGAQIDLSRMQMVGPNGTGTKLRSKSNDHRSYIDIFLVARDQENPPDEAITYGQYLEDEKNYVTQGRLVSCSSPNAPSPSPAAAQAHAVLTSPRKALAPLAALAASSQENIEHAVRPSPTSHHSNEHDVENEDPQPKVKKKAASAASK